MFNFSSAEDGVQLLPWFKTRSLKGARNYLFSHDGVFPGHSGMHAAPMGPCTLHVADLREDYPNAAAVDLSIPTPELSRMFEISQKELRACPGSIEEQERLAHAESGVSSSSSSTASIFAEQEREHRRNIESYNDDRRFYEAYDCQYRETLNSYSEYLRTPAISSEFRAMQDRLDSRWSSSSSSSSSWGSGSSSSSWDPFK